MENTMFSNETISSITLYLSNEELWLIHDCIPIGVEIDGKPIGYDILTKIEEGILLCEDDNVKAAYIEFSLEDLLCITGIIPSTAGSSAKPLLLKAMRGLWQIRNNCRITKEPVRKAQAQRLQEWQEKQQAEVEETEATSLLEARSKKGEDGIKKGRAKSTSRPTIRPRKPRNTK